MRHPRSKRTFEPCDPPEYTPAPTVAGMVHSKFWNAPVPVYFPLLTPEERAALDKADAVAAARRRPRAGRRPAFCTLTRSFNDAERREVPRLRLEGKWMEPLGFRPGGRASVEVRKDGALVIKALPPPPPEAPPVLNQRRGKPPAAAEKRVH